MKKIIIGIVAVVLIIVWISYFSKNSSQPTSQEPIKIGVILPLTGNQASYGEGIKEGLEIALAEINVNSASKISLIYEDNAGETKNSVSAAQKLINIDKVVAVITGPSQHSLAVAPVAEQNKIVLYTMASQTSELNNAGNFIFKNDDDVKSLGERAALLAKELKYDSAGVLFAKYTNAAIDAVNAFKTEFEKLGGKVLISEGFGKDESDFKKYLLKIKNKKPNVIFVNGLPNDNGLILKQFGELNLHQAIIGNATMEDPQIVEIAKNYAEGVIFPTFQGIVSENYIQKVKAKTGKSPLRWSVEAYDGFKIIASAVSNIKGEVNSENLRIELSKIKVYNGESGEIIFDENGNAHRKLFIKTIKNGQFVKYEE